MKQEEKRNREKKELLKKAVRQKKKSTCWKLHLPTVECWKLKKTLNFIDFSFLSDLSTVFKFRYTNIP